MAKKMTEGRPLPLIMGFAVPLLIGNVLQQTYNIIDAAIVGRALGANALASVGASSSVQFLVLGFCIGLACGFGVPIAKSFGAGDMAQMRSHIFHSMFLTGVFAVILTAVCALLCPQILHLLSTPDEIYQGAYNYLIILFLGIPFSLLYNLMSSILRSVGDSRTPFIFLAISTVLNIILDLVCILVFHWGCAGAAAATITAQAVSGISFLGAGVIFKNGNTVKGLTTAAGIWATAAIGLAVGAGMYWVGLFVTLLIAVFQISMHRFTVGADSFCTSRVQFTVSNGEEFAAELQTQLDKWRARVVSSELSRDGDGNLCYDLTLKTAHCIELDDIMQFMTEHKEIIRAEGVPVA